MKYNRQYDTSGPLVGLYKPKKPLLNALNLIQIYVLCSPGSPQETPSDLRAERKEYKDLGVKSPSVRSILWTMMTMGMIAYLQVF